MRFAKKHSCQLRTALLLAIAGGLASLSSGIRAADPGNPDLVWEKAAGLAYGGWPGPGGQGAGWVRVASQPEPSNQAGESSGSSLADAVQLQDRFAFTGEMRQTTSDGPLVFTPSIALQTRRAELFAGSRDIPGRNPTFLSQYLLPGQQNAMSDGLPRGRRVSSVFVRAVFSDGNPADVMSLLPGLWGAKSLSGPGVYVARRGTFLAYHPGTRMWGAQWISARGSPLFYQADFEGQKKELSGYAVARMPGGGSDLPRGMAGGLRQRGQDGVDEQGENDRVERARRARFSLEIERAAEWDSFHYRAPDSQVPFRRYRSWAASLATETGPVRIQIAGQDRGDTAFRVISLERSHPDEAGWYVSPVLRRHMLRLYSDDVTKGETLLGAGMERIDGWGMFRAVVLAGTSRSVGLEVTGGLRLLSGSLEMGMIVSGSEDADAFLFLPVQDVGQGRSHFYDRSTQALMLRAAFPGIELSLHYGVRQSAFQGLRDWGFLRLAVSRPL